MGGAERFIARFSVSPTTHAVSIERKGVVYIIRDLHGNEIVVYDLCDGPGFDIIINHQRLHVEAGDPRDGFWIHRKDEGIEWYLGEVPDDILEPPTAEDIQVISRGLQLNEGGDNDDDQDDHLYKPSWQDCLHEWEKQKPPGFIHFGMMTEHHPPGTTLKEKIHQLPSIAESEVTWSWLLAQNVPGQLS